MTTHARIVIIGGGIVGVSILYHLTKDALLLERLELGAGATWHAAGNVHTQSAFANLSALQAYSLRLYEGLAEEVGQEVDSHVVGGFFLARTKERMEEFKHLAGKFRALGLEYELVSPQEIKAKHPLLNVDDLEGGAWDPEEGYVDPHSVTMGLAAGARKYGGRIRRNVRVERIDRLASGHWRLHAGDEVFECEILVNCAGFWALDVAEMVGTTLPITNMEHQYLVTETMPEIAARIAAQDEELPMIRDCDSQYYLRQEGSGLLLGPWERDCRVAWGGAGGAGRAPWSFGQELFEDDWDRLSEGLAAILHRVPALADAGIKRGVNGAIAFSPDGRPMIGPVPGIPGFFVACAFLGGIAQGGGIGLAMSQWILEGEPELDLHCIDVARFGDWTTPEFARKRAREILPLRYELIYPGIERKSGRAMRTTSIYHDLLAHGAVMGQVYGWERPLWYAPAGVPAEDEPTFQRPNWWEHVGNEARAMASGCGLSEISTYGKFRITGPDARAFLDHIGSARVPTEPGKVALSLLLNERGGIVGDITIENSGDGGFYCVGPTQAVACYLRWMQSHAAAFQVRIDDITDQVSALGIAGPASRDLLNRLCAADSFDDFPFMSSRTVQLGGVSCKAFRISYSGEMGWELHCPNTKQKALFDALMSEGVEHGLALVGSRAMGMLRLEKGYRSWGAELTTEISPQAAGLSRFCSRTKDYIGRAAVDEERLNPPPKRLATLSIDPAAPPCWGTEPVIADGAVIGRITSAGFGWRSNRMLAVAWIDSASAEAGTVLAVQILLQDYKAVVVSDPVYDAENENLKG
ncbi:MAG: FAD-dependent oxidoreductase [Ectothiorhodospiraceae bacterium AqS1]|nr:FAD-dependent oxidoreductase [Ectothiorhodospiraceae bacterium AqS1]MBF2761358.1 FAD-dependent oxidoreductase [Ectothiorhodospiraceae bacterium AqS1]